MTQKPEQTKEEWKVKRAITVDNQPSELVVKASINNEQATFSITAKITTKQISDHDETTNGMVFDQVRTMIKEATTKALAIRAKILQIQQGRLGTDELPFEEGERPSIGQK